MARPAQPAPPSDGRGALRTLAHPLRSRLLAELRVHGQATATELDRPDFVALAGSFGIPAEQVAVEEVGPALERALAAEGPNVVVVQTRLRMWAPSHVAG